jgi:hypothetical protein
VRTRLAVLAVICLGAIGLAAVAGAQIVAPASSGTNVRVLGRFLMIGTVATAQGIPGERPGERVTRTWRIRPYGCAGSDCARVVLVRHRGAQRESKLTLRRIGAGAYRGTGTFWVPLKCLGRTSAHGSLAAYVITLRVTGWTARGAIRYATVLTATDTNSERSDRTRCPLGIVRDSARYVGILKSALPASSAPWAPTTTTAPAPTSPLTPVPAPTPTAPPILPPTTPPSPGP